MSKCISLTKILSCKGWTLPLSLLIYSSTCDFFVLAAVTGATGAGGAVAVCTAAPGAGLDLGVALGLVS
jgi:hypothetical protein